MKLPNFSIASLVLSAAVGWSQTTESGVTADSTVTPTLPATPANSDTVVSADSSLAADSTQAKVVKAPAAVPAAAPVPVPVVLPPAPAEKLKEAFSVHPFTSILIMGFSMSYERFLRPGVSLDIPIFIGLADKLYDQGRFYIGSGLGARYYLTHTQSGGYVSPTFQILNTTFFADETEFPRLPGGNVFSMMGGVRYGYKFLWDFFTIDVGLGLYAFRSYGGDPGTPQTEDVMVVFPMSHLALGIPF